MKILAKHTLKLFFSFLGISLLLFSFILVMDKIFQLAELVIVKGVGAGEIFILLFYSMPMILVLAVPMASAAAGVITFGTMASDKEITAVRSSGCTITPLVKPALISASALAVFMIFFNYYLAPASNYAFQQRFTRLAYRQPALQIEEGTQVEINDYTLLAREVNHSENILREVLISKPATEDEPEMLITARRGTWHTAEDTSLIFTLYDGLIRHQPSGRPEILSSVNFNRYSITLREGEEQVKVSKDLESMSPAEMREKIKNLRAEGRSSKEVSAHYHIRGALAGAVIALVLCGIPLGLRGETRGKTIGTGLSLGIIGIYYFLTVAGLKLAFSGAITPWLGVWFPNFIAAGAGFFMLKNSYNR